MFVDICVPEKNESELSAYAKELKIETLLFLNIKNKKLSASFADGKKIEIFLFPEEGIRKGIYLLDLKKEPAGLKAPTKSFTQVHVKALRDKESILGFCIYDLMDIQKHEKIVFAARLCAKYNVPLFGVTLAKSKSELRKGEDIAATLRACGLEEKQAKSAVSVLSEHVS